MAGGVAGASGPPSTTAPSPTAAKASAERAVAIPISFRVRNVNRSKVACAADGRTYTERGHLVGPAGVLSEKSKTVTLYLHGLGLGQFFWRLKAVAGYDYSAALARAGQASVVLNRLGYNNSGKPPGKQLCLGSQADIAHQEIVDLRDGNYHLDGHRSARFERVVLAGHSFGGLIAQIEAYSFGGINGLIVMSYADQDTSALTNRLAAAWTKACKTTAGRPPTDGHPGKGPLGYEPFGPPSAVHAAFFHNVDPAVLKAAKPMFNDDPCGDAFSFPAAVTADKADLGQVHVPTLLVAGGSDALFPPPAEQAQAARYTGTTSLSLTTIPDTAHALTLERTHRVLESTVAGWLRLNIEPNGFPTGT